MKSTTPYISITDFLTEAEIAQAGELYAFSSPGRFAEACAKQILKPNEARINASLGAEHCMEYLAYAVEYVFMRATMGAKPNRRKGTRHGL